MCAPINTAPAQTKNGEDQAIGHSRGGPSTKIHALVDALGNPVAFDLTGGEAHDLVGADHLLPAMQADTLIGDKAFDAQQRVIDPLTCVGRPLLPLKANRKVLEAITQFSFEQGLTPRQLKLEEIFHPATFEL